MDTKRRNGVASIVSYLIVIALAVRWLVEFARNYIMSSIDKGLEEAALLDGANHIYILFKIIIPRSL